MTITATATDAATRARALAYVVLSRTPLHPAQDVLMRMTELLDTAAWAFETEPAPVIGGITATNTLPGEADMALMDVRELAVDNPGTGITEHVIDHVTAAVTRSPVELPPLGPVSTQLARQEISLLTRIALVAHDMDASSPADMTTRIAHMAALVDLHSKFARLAAAVEVDNARPCNRH